MGCGSSTLSGAGEAVTTAAQQPAAVCAKFAAMTAGGVNGESELQPAAKRSRSSGAGATAAPVAAEAAPGGAALESDADGATLWVGNIPDSLLQESELGKAEAELRRVFFAHGVATAVSVRKKTPGANKSWAFVTFASVDSVQKALQSENFVGCPDGSRVKLNVKLADVQAQMKKRAATPEAGSAPAGAMEKMWNAQHKQVLRGLRTPMQDILESLYEIADSVPSVASQIEQITAVLTSTEDLWSIDQGGNSAATSLASGSFRDVEDEDVKGYLRSHQNRQLQESHAYSQELMQRRYKEKGRRMAVLPDQVLDTSKLIRPDDVSARILRIVPEISDEARIELAIWESRIDSWDFDIFRVNELTNGAPLAFVMFTVFSRYDLLSKLELEER